MAYKIFIKRLKRILKKSVFIIPLLVYATCRYIENLLKLIFFLFRIDLNALLNTRLNDLYSSRFSIPLFSLVIVLVLWMLSNFMLGYKSKRKPEKGKIKNITVLILTVFICLLVLNFALQIFTFVPTNNLKHLQNGTEGYAPFSETTFYGENDKLKPTSVKINSMGFRDYEYSAEKPENTFRIIGLGDSFTFGWGVELDETYLKRLERKLNNGLGAKYEVINLGVIGFNTLQEVELFKNKGSELNPDLITIGFLSGDREEFITSRTIEGVISDFENSKIPLLRWVSMKLGGYKGMKRYNPSHAEPEKYFKKNVETPLTELSQITDKPIVVIVFDFDDSTKQELESLKQKLNIHMVHLDQHYKDYDPSLLRLSEKDIHPTPLAHSLVADVIYDYLKNNKIIPKE